jgi:UDP-N-acetylglucosamine transferase subunit ALG13
MIFVTVGTTENEKLVRYMDDFASTMNESVIIQIGRGKYKPQNCEYFDIKSSLNTYYKGASVVVGSGGVGTTFELLHQGKRFVAVSNTDIPDNHQEQILEKLSEQGYLIWCKNLENLERDIKHAKSYKFKQYVQPDCWIEQVILDNLK